MQTQDRLKFHVPPRCQGQMVEIAYAATEDGHVVKARTDRSEPGEGSTYVISAMLKDDDGDYWNGEPHNKRWRDLTPAELKRYGLT
jgi:hypothetical protein